MDRLSAMRSFRRVVELGSFNKAAEAVRLSTAGLSKQVRALEEELGVVLIHRTTRRMNLTETGRVYYAECCRLLDDHDKLDRGISELAAKPGGRLRINVPVSFGLTVISDLLPKFLLKYPGLRLEVTLDDQLLDVVTGGFDVTIRIRPELDDSSLIVRCLGEVNQYLCAAPEYINTHGMPKSLDELSRHACLDYTLSDTPGTWRFEGGVGPGVFPVPSLVSANNSLLLGHMLVAGAGIGSLPSFIACPLFNKGKLIPVDVGWKFRERKIFALYPTNRHLQKKVRVFVEFLATELADKLRHGINQKPKVLC